MSRRRYLRYGNPSGRNPRDVVGIVLDKPHLSIRSHRDPERRAAAGRDGIFGEHSLRGDRADLVPVLLGEPHHVVSSEEVTLGRAPPVGTVYSVIAPDIVTLATLLASLSATQMLPSGPAATPPGSLPGEGSGYSVKTPAVVTFATWLAPSSENQSLPSGPTAIPSGAEFPVGGENSVKAPEVVRRPILLIHSCVNHRFPSGPATMNIGLL